MSSELSHISLICRRNSAWPTVMYAARVELIPTLAIWQQTLFRGNTVHHKDGLPMWPTLATSNQDMEWASGKEELSPGLKAGCVLTIIEPPRAHNAIEARLAAATLKQLPYESCNPTCKVFYLTNTYVRVCHSRPHSAHEHRGLIAS